MCARQSAGHAMAGTLRVHKFVVTTILAIIVSRPSPALGGSSPGGVGWEYTGPYGPTEWQKQYPECAGRMQSPININTRAVLYDPSMQVFDLRQYATCEACKMKLSNVDGHTAEVKFSGTPIVISGGSLPDDYVLDQFHFHWGSQEDKGSEHTVDYNSAPMELHIVHHMSSSANSSEAAKHPYGLAVLGFFFKIGDHNPSFDRLLTHFSRISHRGSEIEIEPFALKSLLPVTASTYYRYFGSLTTPPCYETVIWTLFTQRIEISNQQLAMFRTLKTVRANETEEVSIVNDFRPLQQLHERRVYSNDLQTVSNLAQSHLRLLQGDADRWANTCSTGTATRDPINMAVLSVTLVTVMLL